MHVVYIVSVGLRLTLWSVDTHTECAVELTRLLPVSHLSSLHFSKCGYGLFQVPPTFSFVVVLCLIGIAVCKLQANTFSLKRDTTLAGPRPPGQYFRDLSTSQIAAQQSWTWIECIHDCIGLNQVLEEIAWIVIVLTGVIGCTMYCR